MRKQGKTLLITFCICLCFFIVGSVNTVYSDTEPSVSAGEGWVIPYDTPPFNFDNYGINVEVIGNEIIGLNTLTNVRVVEKLKEGESVTAALSKGKIGAVLTDRRLLGFNAITNTWTSFETFFNKDVFPNEIKVSSNMALAIAKRRVYAYTSASNEWKFELISFTEQTLSCDISDNLIFVRTSDRLLTFPLHKHKWFPQNLYAGEEIKDVAMGENFVTVTIDNMMSTDKRILTFNAKDGKWTEERLKPGDSPSKEQADAESGDNVKAPKAPDSKS